MKRDQWDRGTETYRIRTRRMKAKAVDPVWVTCIQPDEELFKGQIKAAEIQKSRHPVSGQVAADFLFIPRR